MKSRPGCPSSLRGAVRHLHGLPRVPAQPHPRAVRPETGNNRESVALGQHQTGGIITGAALIMVAVFGGFAAGDLVMFQQLGFQARGGRVPRCDNNRAELVPAAMRLWVGQLVVPALPHLAARRAERGEPEGPARPPRAVRRANADDEAGARRCRTDTGRRGAAVGSSATESADGWPRTGRSDGSHEAEYRNIVCVHSRRAWACGRPSSAVAKFLFIPSAIHPAGMRDHVRGCRVPGAWSIVRGFD